MKLILASASPRRKSLMEVLGLDFEIKVSNCEEVINPDNNIQDIVMSLALQKANDVAKDYDDCIVIGADTVVYSKNQILGKHRHLVK